MIDRCDWSDLPTNQCGCRRCQKIGPTIGARINLPPREPQYPAGTKVAWKPTDDKRPETRDWHDGDAMPQSGTRCHWNRETNTHVLREHLAACTERACNGCKPCTHDDHGNPITHCRARRSCTEHLDHAHPRTCPRCIARVRNDLAQIERLAALMPAQAETDGITSTAAMIAGPAADPDRIERRGILYAEATIGITDPKHPAMRALAAWDADTLDENHPTYVLSGWETRLREHLRHEDSKQAPTLARAVSYLSFVLTDLAQDPAAGFDDLANEVNDCRKYLENVLGASRAPERGAPCKECDGPAPRLTRKRAHWCDDDTCTREHDTTGARDTWTCPRNPAHWWTEADYRKWSYERADETKGKMGA